MAWSVVYRKVGPSYPDHFTVPQCGVKGAHRPLLVPYGIRAEHQHFCIGPSLFELFQAIYMVEMPMGEQNMGERDAVLF